LPPLPLMLEASPETAWVGPYGWTCAPPLHPEHCTGLASLHADTEMFWTVVGSWPVVKVRVAPSAQAPHDQVPLAPLLERHFTEV